MTTYRMLWDLHTHTTYSHGTGSIEDNVRAAREAGLAAIGISDHGPDHKLYGVKEKLLPEMKEEVRRLRAKYPDIKILLGLECNIINSSGRIDLPKDSAAMPDYIMAGYHYGGVGENPLAALALHGGNKLKLSLCHGPNTRRMVNSIRQNAGIIRIVTHPADKGAMDIMAIGQACLETGALMEINDSHRALTAEHITRLKDLGVGFVIGSDAHRPENVGKFQRALDRALEAGLDPSRIINIVPDTEPVEETQKRRMPQWMQLL
ncbi:MAG: PHP domain-containing protein [Clostridiales bacterium]|nr:PHP domain-containing protein [Clostridiales bacterium]